MKQLLSEHLLRTSAILCALVVLLWLLFSSWSVLIFALAVPFWALLFCSLLLVHRVVRHFFPRLPAMRYPKPLQRLERTRTFFVAMLSVLILITAVREGVLGDSLSADFSWSSSSTNTRSHFTSSKSEYTTSRTSQPKQHVSFARSFIVCTVTCQFEGTVCDAFRSNLSCDGYGLERPLDNRPLTTVHLRVNHSGDSFCYTPLLKSASLRASFSATLHGERKTGASHATKDVSIDGTVHIEHSRKGVSSCRAVHKTLGLGLATEVAKSLNGVIRAN